MRWILRLVDHNGPLINTNRLANKLSKEIIVLPPVTQDTAKKQYEKVTYAKIGFSSGRK